MFLLNMRAETMVFFNAIYKFFVDRNVCLVKMARYLSLVRIWVHVVVILD